MTISEEAIDAAFDALGHEPISSDEMREVLEAAYPHIRPPAITPGVYRNRLNVELTITDEPFMGGLGGGDIVYAERQDELFGITSYLVTAHSLREAGYELVQAAK